MSFWLALSLPPILFYCFGTFILAAIVPVAVRLSATRAAETEVSSLQTQPGICGWFFRSSCLSLFSLLSADSSPGNRDLTGFSRLAEELPRVLEKKN